MKASGTTLQVSRHVDMSATRDSWSVGMWHLQCSFRVIIVIREALFFDLPLMASHEGALHTVCIGEDGWILMTCLIQSNDEQGRGVARNLLRGEGWQKRWSTLEDGNPPAKTNANFQLRRGRHATQTVLFVFCGKKIVLLATPLATNLYMRNFVPPSQTHNSLQTADVEGFEGFDDL